MSLYTVVALNNVGLAIYKEISSKYRTWALYINGLFILDFLICDIIIIIHSTLYPPIENNHDSLRHRRDGFSPFTVSLKVSKHFLSLYPSENFTEEIFGETHLRLSLRAAGERSELLEVARRPRSRLRQIRRGARGGTGRSGTCGPARYREKRGRSGDCQAAVDKPRDRGGFKDRSFMRRVEAVGFGCSVFDQREV